MRSFALGFSTVLVAIVAEGQTVDRTIYFTHTDDPQNIQEVATLCRTIADIKEVSVDAAQRSMTLQGTPDQISVVEWLVKRLDQPLGDPHNSDANELKMPDVRGDNVVRLIYLTHNQTIQQFQEIATSVRTTADVRRVFTYNTPRAMVLRGTADQIALATWLTAAFDVPLNAPLQHASAEYRVPPASDDVTRVFFLAHTETVQNFQEIVTLVRTMTNIRRVFTYNDRAAMAEWLVDQLDQVASAHTKVAEFTVPKSSDDLLRIYYLPSPATVKDFQTSVTAIRNATGIRRVFTYNARRAVALRGTSDQMAQAERMIAGNAQ